MKIIYFDGDIKVVSLKDVCFCKDNFYWFCVSPAELQLISDKVFKFNEVCVRECKSTSQVAKVDFYDEYTFLVLNSLKYEGSTVLSDEFNVFLGQHYIITVSEKEVGIIKELEEELLNIKTGMYFNDERYPSKLLYYILDKLILNDYSVISLLENKADVLELNILKNPDTPFLNQLLHLRHQVHTLRRCIAPLRYIGDNLLCNENDLIEDESLKNFHKINDKIEKLMFAFESLVQYIVLVREAFEAEMSNKTTELMKRFTIIAMFFSPLTLITGIYGMNIRMPSSNTEHGYLHVLLLMLGVSFALYLYFKKKKWL